MIRVLVVALALLVAGCARDKVTPVLAPAADAKVWPSLPDQPRYAYAGTLLGEKDFLAKKPDEGRTTGEIFFEILTGLIFGEADYKELLRPVSGLVDAKGRVLVVDAARPGVAVFDMPGKDFDIWQRAADEESFIAPVGIVEDGAGGFLITDSELKQVFRLDGKGNPLPGFGRKVLDRPTGIARDPRSGNVYVADTSTHRIVIFSPAGEVVDVIGGRGRAPGTFNYPTHLAIARDHLYVADTLNFRIQVFDLAGDGTLSIGQLGMNVGNLTRPKGVGVGRDGRVYVVESYFDHLLVYDSQGRFLLPIGGSGSGPGEFYLPAGVWTDATGRVYVADMFNGRVSVFQELTAGGEG